jgi:hypothetical protein
MKLLSLIVLLTFVSLTRYAEASIPTNKITEEMNKYLDPFLKKTGWNNFVKTRPNSTDGGQPFVSTEDLRVKIGDEEYVIGLGYRTVFIEATPKTVVGIVDNPIFFQSLYGLDKPALVSPANSDGTYRARIFKLVPGIETQDFTLDYRGHWEGDSWIGQAKLVKDEREFALRNNIKIVEPHGTGSIYREVALFFPLRWWMRGLLHGTVQAVTKKEMTKLNKSIKCASEEVQSSGVAMNDEIGKKCFAEASK